MIAEPQGRYRIHLSLCTPASYHSLQHLGAGTPQKPTPTPTPTFAFRDLFEGDAANLSDLGIVTGEHVEAQLYSPRKEAATKALDPRLGRIGVQSLNVPFRIAMPSAHQPVPPSAVPPDSPSSLSASAAASSSIWRSRYTKSSSFVVEAEEASGASTEVSFGILHLFRESAGSASRNPSSSSDSRANESLSDPQVAFEDESATVLAILGLPSQITAADFLSWIEPALASVEKIRMIREGASLHRVTVLVKFRDPVDAEEFYKQYAGQSLPFAATPSSRLGGREEEGPRSRRASATTSTGNGASQPPTATMSNATPFPSFSSSYASRPTAQIVYITQVTVSAAPQLPYAYPQLANSDPWPLIPAAIASSDASNQGSHQESGVIAAPSEGANAAATPSPAARLALSLANELPTCPVCLERMDSSVTGIMTVSCQHSFHCECLSRWGDGRCPVCRYSQSRAAKKGPASLFASARRQLQSQAGHRGSSPMSSLGGEAEPSALDNDEALHGQEDHAEEEEDEATQCTVCGTTDDLWVCLICATVGCGRYKKGCAKRHFVETGHLYSLEVETSRVWDYVHDGYIHRLIQNRADGKLVELPSTTNPSTAQSTPSRRRRHRPHRGHRRHRCHHHDHAPAEAGSSRQQGSSHSSSHASDDGEDGDDTDSDDGEEVEKTGGKLTGSDAKLEAISLEYQYLLLSQLESQRSYYEGQVRRVQAELDEARSAGSSSELSSAALMERERELQAQRAVWEEKLWKSQEREKAVSARYEKALESSSKLSRDLDSERALSKGLFERLKNSQLQAEARDREAAELRRKCQDQEEQLRDLMFALEAQHKIQQADQRGPSDESAGRLAEARGGDLVIKGGGGTTRRSARPTQTVQESVGVKGGAVVDPVADEGDGHVATASTSSKKKNKKKKAKAKAKLQAKGSAVADDERGSDHGGGGGGDDDDDNDDDVNENGVDDQNSKAAGNTHG